ncbi:MAG: penicillin-binding protein 2 [Propionibacteriaceae bacterium]|jgi:cell division protein FtsI (penicillin-binding protein 3)|nr:penicillin-binding protein 2 [Propionibacteriaceae bacterium]
MTQRPIAASRALTVSKRVQVFSVAMGVLAAIALGKALLVQGIDAVGAAEKAAAAMTMSKPIKAERGVITDRNGLVLAEDYAVGRLIADPWGMKTNGIVERTPTTDELSEAAMAPLAIAQILVRHLGGDVNDYLYHLNRTTLDDNAPNQYELIASNVPLYTYQQIRSDMRVGCGDDVIGGCYYGLTLELTPKRSYPNGMIAANVVGFTFTEQDGSRIGAAGVEQYLQNELAGVDGTETYLSAPYGDIPFADSTLIPAVNGSNVQLTLDSELQYALQQELQAAVAKGQGQQGWAIVMNVKTAEILAMANYPTYDPNDFGSAPQSDLGNRAVSWTYEPGSVAKVLTMAALLDQGLITNDTHVVVPASLPSGDGLIEDFSPHDTLYMTARGVLANSSNIGTVLLSQLSSKEALHDYWLKFGLGMPTGIENPGEGDGTLGLIPPADMEDYARNSAAFGQGISVTAVQLTAALAAAVNGGVYHAPTLISQITDTNGEAVVPERQAAHRVISSEASAAVRDMMEAQAMATYAASEALPGYRWLGKSGTAQRVDPNTGLYGAYTSSYVGIAPAEDPTIMVYMAVDNTYEYGSSVVRPGVVDVLRYALPRYGFMPASEIAPYVGDQYYR